MDAYLWALEGLIMLHSTGNTCDFVLILTWLTSTSFSLSHIIALIRAHSCIMFILFRYLMATVNGFYRSSQCRRVTTAAQLWPLRGSSIITPRSSFRL